MQERTLQEQTQIYEVRVTSRELNTGYSQTYVHAFVRPDGSTAVIGVDYELVEPCDCPEGGKYRGTEFYVVVKGGKIVEGFEYAGLLIGRLEGFTYDEKEVRGLYAKYKDAEVYVCQHCGVFYVVKGGKIAVHSSLSMNTASAVEDARAHSQDEKEFAKRLAELARAMRHKPLRV